MQHADNNDYCSREHFDQLSPILKGSATDWASFFKMSENATPEFKFDAINEIGKALDIRISRTDPQNGPVTFKVDFGETSITADPMVEVTFGNLSKLLKSLDDGTFVPTSFDIEKYCNNSEFMKKCKYI